MKKDGGPAFPLENPRMMEDGELFKQFPGMTLRDWFAGQALAGCGKWAPSEKPGIPLPECEKTRDRAAWAYKQADAMLAERDRT